MRSMSTSFSVRKRQSPLRKFFLVSPANITRSSSVTEKQKTAMKQAGIPYVYQSAYELTYTCLKKLLGVIDS